MGAQFAKFVLKVFGWKVDMSKPKEKSFVIVVAPHTSNWDFIIGRLTIEALGVKQRVLMKSSWFFFPLKYILHWLGAIPINRKSSVKMVDYIVDLFKAQDDFVFAITPEGTRSYVKRWKSGFYHIAVKANVPLVLGSIDYKKKVAGLNKVIYPSGDVEKDLREILDYYKDIHGRFPEKYNPNPQINS